MTRGLIQVYTGDGKGKTTAALGLALRASGAGYRVYIAQFAKGRDSGELAALRDLETIEIRRFGKRAFIQGEPGEDDRALAQKGLRVAGEALRSGKYRVVILDEACIAVRHGLFDSRDLLEVIENREPGVEAVITGRGATEDLIAVADLVTEMRAIKHYFNQGVGARKGIEF